jgi:hypothetical protein
MDRETAVLRAEMSQTRAELDRKLTQLEARARELTPKRLSQRYMPEYLWERVIGSALTLVGLKMAWSQYRTRQHRRSRVRGAMTAYGHW